MTSIVLLIQYALLQVAVNYVLNISISESLPNITGHCDLGGIHTYSVTSNTPPFTIYDFRPNTSFSQVSSTSQGLHTFNINFSLANSVYKNNASVTPNSKTVRYFIRY